MLPLIAGGGATVASMFLNSMAGRKADKAREGVMSAERARQAALDAEADALNKGSRERYVGFEGQQDARAASLSDMYRQPAGTNAGMPPMGSDLVAREVEGRLDSAKAFGDQQAGALGNLRSFGDLLGGISRSQARDASLVGQIGGFKRGSASITPYELEEAGHAGDKLKFWADVSAGAGKIGIMNGLSGGVAAGAAGAGAPMAVGPRVAPSIVGSFAPPSNLTTFNPYALY